MELDRNTRIAVLMGGLSAEREVSLSSGEGVMKALADGGYLHVTGIDVGRDIAERLGEVRPHVVFNALHGKYGEDGTIQGLLDLLGIPYTHSGVLASALAMNKEQAKKVFAAAGIPVAHGRVVSRSEMIKAEPMPRPFVVKPVDEGSSVGVSIFMPGDNYYFNEETWAFGEEVLVERYIPGREVQAAVLDGEALGVIEIRPKSGFYDYQAKYTSGFADHLMPAPIDQAAYDKIMEYALIAHESLGCRGVSRSDFRYDDDPASPTHGIYILELNNQPGMTPLSLTPEIAAYRGISYLELIERLLRIALL